jgi:hypothetical protein
LIQSAFLQRLVALAEHCHWMLDMTQDVMCWHARAAFPQNNIGSSTLNTDGALYMAFFTNTYSFLY